ncbi:TPA: glycosyltransferase family 4 protein [Candidatus Micrarchaeota archaeon]|nr:glycosyltransferase family 4 protein [Candidatus Micrarchaeota archaeon]
MNRNYAVDYINGPTSKSVYGIKRYQDEVHRLLPRARLNRIEYLQPKSRMMSILRRAIFPFEVMLRAKRGNLKHFTTQYLAYLLFLPGMNKSIVTVYDTVFIERYNDFPFLTRLFIKANIAGIRRAKKIITISDYSAGQIHALLGIEPSRIAIIKPGMDTTFFSRKMRQPEKWGAKGSPVVLSLGSEDPRQNIDKVITAVSKLKEEFPRIFLLKAGNPQWKGGREQLLGLVEKLGLEKNVLFLNFVQDEKLPSLYSSADVFVYPCSSTGWGLPPAEAMACGTPVVTSKVPPLPEVVGDGALKVDPGSAGQIAAAVRKLLKNSELRINLAKKAAAHLKNFSWKKAAAQTEKTYLSLLS